jgi:predicted O-linked N-acetylglucosamine transferase (SPINDLY family)
LPDPPGGGFVFCCFNNSYKIGPEMFARWMRIVSGTPGSVLWLIDDNAAATENLRGAAAAHGLDPARLIFAPRLALPRHLARHRLADLFLDTLPYNAHTTASDALWAGLPLLTCRGTAFAGRVAASLLEAVGLPELITETPEDYETTALELARTPDRLARLRQELCANRRVMPLFDTLRFTRDLEAAFTAMQERRRAGLAPDHITVSA